MMGADYQHVCNLRYNLMARVQEMYLSLDCHVQSFVLHALK